MYNPQLETFLRVADAGSFSKAAEEAYITPAAVIKQINLLENSLDVKLFERTHRGLILTKAGKSLYQDTKYIIQYCKDSVTRAKNAMQENVNVIRIGSSPMTPAQLLMQLWPKIQPHCPELKFEIVPFENTPENVREILANLGRKIDVIGGIFDKTLLELRSCAGLRLTQEPLCCAVSIHHPLAAKDRLKFSDLYGENLLLMRRGWSHHVDELMKNYDYEAHLKKVRGIYKRRRDVMIEAVRKHFPEDVKVVVPQGGIFLWMEFEKGVDTLEMFDEIFKEDLAYVPGTFFYPDGSGRNTMRLNFCTNPEEVIETEMARMGRLIKAHLKK